jgi:hypothetical protein
MHDKTICSDVNTKCSLLNIMVTKWQLTRDQKALLRVAYALDIVVK